MSAPDHARMFVALTISEVRTQLSRMGTWSFALLYISIGLLTMLAIGGTFEQVTVATGSGNTNVDSPHTITILSLALSLFATLNVAAISGNAACRDAEDGSFPLVYTAPVRRSVFLGSRWLGSLTGELFIAAAIPAGLLLGARLPVLEDERTGSWAAMSFFVTLLGWVLPNLVFCSALFFGLAALTRRMFPNYIGGVLLLVGYLGSQTITSDLDNKTLAALIDPFGIAAFVEMTDYWSAHERNTLLVWPTGVALANRALWASIGLAALVAGVSLAKLDQYGWQLDLAPLRRRSAALKKEEHERAGEISLPEVARRFDAGTRLRQMAALSERALRDVIGHRYFWAFVAAAVLFQMLNAQVIGSLYGTTTWPVTYEAIEILEGTLGIFLLVILTFYAGDLVWHERDLASAGLYDSCPTPDSAPLFAKFIALFAVIAGMHTTVLVMGVLVQLWQGYTDLEIPLYLQWLYGLSLLDWLPYVALALAVHAVLDNKIAGHMLLIGFYSLQSFRGALGFQYNLFWFGSDPGRVYSDMNGWGSFLGPFLVYKLYWLSASIVLLVLARLMWVRGGREGLQSRLKEARRRLDVPTRAALGAGGLLTALFAAYIGVQTSIVRTYTSQVEESRELVAYEQRYKAQWEGKPHPKIVDVDLTVDLFPKEGALEAQGKLILENQTPGPIGEILLGRDTDNEILSLTFDHNSQREVLDEDMGLDVVRFDPPLGPGERTLLSFSLRRPDEGMRNQGGNTMVVANGSFVNAGVFLPVLGYDRGFEISSPAERRKYDLPERPRMLDLDDPVARTRNYITDDADRTPVQILVRTDADQVALAPGSLVEQGKDGDRAWFRYRTVKPILHFYSVLSGKWTKVTDKHGDTAIEIYHEPRHTFNVARMIEGIKDSLDLFESAFGAFQYGEIRIVEFPRYATFAQSFPSTIPFSEAIGFIARVTDPDEDVDYPYYVTAHEVAHQWWAHQVVGADAQGSTVLSETLAQYSAMKVMAREYGEDQIHRFLRYEADNYFIGRATEPDKEVPLLRVENQPYIHYRKGAIVMWALREAAGEARLDASIRRFLDGTRDMGPPYPTARDLYDVLRADLPEHAPLLRDLFERIVLYENRPTRAIAKRLPDGRYEVTLDLKLEKTVADEVGEEVSETFDEEIAVGVFSGSEEDRKTLYLQRHRLAGPEASLTVVVDEAPSLAGIDPNHLMLDRGREDNLMSVTIEGE